MVVKLFPTTINVLKQVDENIIIYYKKYKYLHQLNNKVNTV